MKNSPSSSIMESLQGSPTQAEHTKGAFAMCKKMLQESDTQLRELRQENERLKAELASLKKLSNLPQEEAAAVIALRAQVQRYKQVVRDLSEQIVALKKAK